MTDLDIYDSQSVAKSQHKPSRSGIFRRTFDEYTLDIFAAINEKTEKLKNAEEKVLLTIQPATKYSPISYDTVKRVAIITLCTYSGMLQGRARAGYRRLLYPVLGFTAGNAACYPKQTYHITSKVLTTGLPIIASAGKATVEVGSTVISSSSRGVRAIYEKVSEQFTLPPQTIDTEVSHVEPPQPDDEEALYDVEISSIVAEESKLGDDTLGAISGEGQETEHGEIVSDKMTTEISVLDKVSESKEILEISVLDELAESKEILEISVLDELAESKEVLEASDKSAVATDQMSPVVEATTGQVMPLISDQIISEVTSDHIIPVDQITLPKEGVAPLEGDLGMGDKEHDDMYSTRSA